jgi:pyrrolidone-carboxylate peptidase
MKFIVFLSFFLGTVMASTKTIVISSFDPFNQDRVNNSRIIAKKVMSSFSHPKVKLHHCELRTVYQKSTEELQDCIRSLEDKPALVISLGQGLCHLLKFETFAYNLNNSTLEDNDGVVRKQQVIEPSAEEKRASKIDWTSFISTLSRRDQRKVALSDDPGRFVCNDLMFRNLDLLDMPYSFVHVPTTKCLFQKSKINKSAQLLEKVLIHYANKL